ncbi:hypothetical protein ACFOTA_02990 [Chitinophaga sp. GCM10012297]|uniref:Auto-transporter adhesin head GIN domain-containing protein n=1 Tax=Chitinophaga chungangae TaxID=2821488 RepID=A0ABS3Y8Z6_9BACT|nr:hypothetical protein [Chitinophaga chungangae]MBO9151157.1 hypothetical protein [Chitinophaga chungangae]
MKRIKWLFALFFLLATNAYSQHVYQIRADSVRIYNVCDTAELIIENRTRGVSGYLFNKGNGRTEFRPIRLETVGSSQIAITGQDTLDIASLSGLSGGIDSIYRSGDSLIYVKNGVAYGVSAPGSGGGANIYTADGTLTGNRVLLGSGRAYSLTLDSLNQFRAKGNLVSVVGGQNNTQASLLLQGGQSNWDLLSSGTRVVSMQLDVGRALLMVDSASLSVGASTSMSPGVRLEGAVTMDFMLLLMNHTIGKKGYFFAMNTQFQNITIALPPSTVGRVLMFKKVHAANVVTLTPYGSEKIDGQTSATLTDNNQVLRLVGMGSGWYIM